VTRALLAVWWLNQLVVQQMRGSPGCQQAVRDAVVAYSSSHSRLPNMLCRALKGLLGGLSASACGLVLTEPYLNLPALREAAVSNCCRRPSLHAASLCSRGGWAAAASPALLLGTRQRLAVGAVGSRNSPSHQYSSRAAAMPPAASCVWPGWFQGKLLGAVLRSLQVRMALDELGFASIYMAPPAALALRWHAQQLPGLPANAAGCGLVVDAGFSFTHAVSGASFSVCV